MCCCPTLAAGTVEPSAGATRQVSPTQGGIADSSRHHQPKKTSANLEPSAGATRQVSPTQGGIADSSRHHQPKKTSANRNHGLNHGLMGKLHGSPPRCQRRPGHPLQPVWTRWHDHRHQRKTGERQDPSVSAVYAVYLCCSPTTITCMSSFTCCLIPSHVVKLSFLRSSIRF